MAWEIPMQFASNMRLQKAKLCMEMSGRNL